MADTAGHVAAPPAGLVDREAAAAAQGQVPGGLNDGPTQAKPLAVGAVTAGNAWFAVACAVLLLVPLSLTNGVTAGSWYLASIGVHVLVALPDLVVDNHVGYRHLALRIALRTGATRVLVLACLWTAAVTAGLVLTAFGAGVRA